MSRSRPMFYLLVLVALVSLLFPFYWIMVTSLKSPGEDRHALRLIPRSFALSITQFTLRSPDRRTGDATKKPLDDLLEQDRAVVQYSVDFRESPGTVDVTYDRYATDVARLRQAFATLGYEVARVDAPTRFPVLANYARVFQQHPFLTYLRNSAVVATCTTLLCLLVGSLCAYALARLTFRFRDAVLSLVLAVSMFPPIAVVSPLFLMLKHAHLLNTYAALVLPYTAFGLPLTIWTLNSFFRELPRDLEESARVDGCTRFQAFVKIILPLAAPGVFTCAILVFIGAWNEFLFALVFITKPILRTVPVGITMIPGQFEMPWGTIFAAATVVTLPLVVVVFLFQKRIIAGLTAGAVKG